MFLVPTRDQISDLLNDVPAINGVPKVYHQMWYSKVPVLAGTYTGPVRYLTKMDTFREHNPDWLHIVWTNDTVDWLLEQEKAQIFVKTFNQMHHAIQKADLARLIVLYCYGGLYADLDFDTLGEVDSLLEDFTDEEAVIFQEKSADQLAWLEPDCVINNCIIARPGASVIVGLFDNVERLIPGTAVNVEVLHLTGPRAIHEYLYGPASAGRHPIWKVQEYEGHNQGRVNNRSFEVLSQHFSYPRGDNSGWAIDIVESHFWHYGKIFVALFVLLIVLSCAVLYFFRQNVNDVGRNTGFYTSINHVTNPNSGWVSGPTTSNMIK